MCYTPDSDYTSLEYTQPWYPELLNLSVKEPMLLPQGKQILISPKIIVHSLMVKNWSKLATWLVSGNIFCAKEFEKAILTLSQIPDKKTHSFELAGVFNKKFLPRHL